MVHHLYVHVPFCHHICPYCGFYKHKPGGTDVGAFVDALGRELQFVSDESELSLKTVYLGGGTPSLLSSAHWEQLFGHLERFLGPTVVEFGLEANPRTFDLAKARLWKQSGVSRVSLGVQSLEPETLRTLGRDHSPDDARAAYDDLRNAEIPSVNVDLMFAIPGQTLEMWGHSLNEASNWQTDHVSTYNLTYEEDTDFLKRFESGELSQDPDRDAEFFELVHHRLGEAGFAHYEVSNHAKPGFESQHNLAIWRGNDYVAIGPGGVSTVGGVRWKNRPDTSAWMQQVQAVGHSRVEVETLTAEQREMERLALALRTSDGFPVPGDGSISAETIQLLENEGLIERVGARIRLTLAGMMLADEVTMKLVEG